MKGVRFVEFNIIFCLLFHMGVQLMFRYYGSFSFSSIFACTRCCVSRRVRVRSQWGVMSRDALLLFFFYCWIRLTCSLSLSFHSSDLPGLFSGLRLGKCLAVRILGMVSDVSIIPQNGYRQYSAYVSTQE